MFGISIIKDAYYFVGMGAGYHGQDNRQRNENVGELVSNVSVFLHCGLVCFKSTCLDSEVS